MCQLIGNDPSQLTMIGETSLSAMSVRPDYAVEYNAVEYNGALVGFIEVKAPGKGADPQAFSASHDREQWRKLQARCPTSFTPTARLSACTRAVSVLAKSDR
jgi:hypothetical protein